MKKKASLLISGITTVAMLAVAVGSFAAWDTLTGKTEGLTVSTSTPVAITVTTTPESSVNKIVPQDAEIVGSNESKDYVKIGTFNAKLTGEDADNGKDIKTTYTVKMGNTAIDTNIYDVQIKDVTNNSSPTTVNVGDDLNLAETDKTYEVSIKYAASKVFTSEELNAYTASDLNINIELKADKNTTV